MVLPSIFQTIQDTLLATFGNLAIVSLLIIIVFLVGFLFTGIDFRYSILLTIPLILVFSRIGWIPQFIGGLFWILTVMIGGYIAWGYIKGER